MIAYPPDMVFIFLRVHFHVYQTAFFILGQSV